MNVFTPPVHENPYLSARYDTQAGTAPAPTRSYLVCASPRSGSSLLSLALSDVGGLGVPTEYFNRAFREFLVRRWGCSNTLDAYVAALHARRTTLAGLFSSKLHWFQLIGLRNELLDPARRPGMPNHVDAALLASILPECRYVWIRRDDVVGQAVSLFRALATNRWEAPAKAPPRRTPAPTYDFDAIDRCRRRIELEDDCWARFFRTNGIAPHVVVYETLDRDYVATLRAAIRFVGADADRLDIPAAPIRRQRDHVSADYTAAYARDCAARGIRPRRLTADPLAERTPTADAVYDEHDDLLGLVPVVEPSLVRRAATRLRGMIARPA